MDARIRNMQRRYQEEPTPQNLEALQHEYLRAGMIGPIFAKACSNLARLQIAISKRQGSSVSGSVYRILSLRDPEYPLEPLLELSNDIQYQISDLQSYAHDTLPENSPIYERYVDTFLPLLLFLNREHIKKYDGEEGYCLETLTRREFATKVGDHLKDRGRAGQDAKYALEYAVKLFEGEKTLDNYWEIGERECEGAVELLPPPVQQGLKELWEASEDDENGLSTYGEFLKDRYGDWIGQALWAGADAGQESSMYDEFKELIKDVAWDKGARAIDVDFDEIDIWIPINLLREAILAGVQFDQWDELTEDLVSPRHFSFGEYPLSDDAVIREVLLDNIPEELQSA